MKSSGSYFVLIWKNQLHHWALLVSSFKFTLTLTYGILSSSLNFSCVAFINTYNNKSLTVFQIEFEHSLYIFGSSINISAKMILERILFFCFFPCVVALLDHSITMSLSDLKGLLHKEKSIKMRYLAIHQYCMIGSLNNHVWNCKCNYFLSEKIFPMTLTWSNILVLIELLLELLSFSDLSYISVWSTIHYSSISILHSFY